MSGLIILGFVGIFVAPVVSAIAFADATRRGQPLRSSLVSAVSVGAVSFAGFLAPEVFRDQLLHLYLGVIKPGPVAVAPFEMIAVKFGTAFIISAVALLVYTLGRQHD